MPKPQRPNLLFVFTDEQRFDTLECERGPSNAYPPGSLRMPNLNRFAEQACHVSETWCTQPVCTPSRGSILTGLYPHAHGAVNNNIPLNADADCLPEILQQAGIDDHRTGYHGKWHLGDEIFAQHGFAEWRAIEDHYRPWYSKSRDKARTSDYYNWLRAEGFKPDLEREFSRGMATNLPEAFTKPAFLAREACRFLEENRDHPFVLYVNFLEPHMPFFGTNTNRYHADEVPLPPNFNVPPSADMPKANFLHEFRKREGFEWYDLSTEKGWRQMIAAYMGLNTLVDTHFGRILRRLEELGLDDNTVVVFTSDHGDMMGSHRLMAKQFMYQESARVPLLIRLPGQREPMRLDGPFSQIDLVPTLLELLGCPVPDHLHGRSRAAKLTPGTDQQLDEDVVVCWNPHPGKETAGDPEEKIAPNEPVRTLVTADGWRFSHHPLTRCHELFNLREDPLESKNLAADPAQADRIREGNERLRQWQARTGDPVALADS